jgi:hypothetical protein
MPGKDYGPGGKWIYERAKSLKKEMKKQYGAKKGEQVAFATATQMAHKLKKTPKKGAEGAYGTSKGKRTAMRKFDKPRKLYKKTAEAVNVLASLNKTGQQVPIPTFQPQAGPGFLQALIAQAQQRQPSLLGRMRGGMERAVQAQTGAAAQPVLRATAPGAAAAGAGAAGLGGGVAAPAAGAAAAPVPAAGAATAARKATPKPRPKPRKAPSKAPAGPYEGAHGGKAPAEALAPPPAALRAAPAIPQASMRHEIGPVGGPPAAPPAAAPVRGGDIVHAVGRTPAKGAVGGLSAEERAAMREAKGSEITPVKRASIEEALMNDEIIKMAMANVIDALFVNDDEELEKIAAENELSYTEMMVKEALDRVLAASFLDELEKISQGMGLPTQPAGRRIGTGPTIKGPGAGAAKMPTGPAKPMPVGGYKPGQVKVQQLGGPAMGIGGYKPSVPKAPAPTPSTAKKPWMTQTGGKGGTVAAVK